MSHHERDTPGVIAPPPLIFAVPFALGALPHWLWQLPELPAEIARPLGLALAAFGVVPALLAVIAMLRARTAIEPWHPSTRLVTGGPFRFSRNPIYLSFTLLYAAGALLLNVPAALLLLPAALVAVRRGVIDREERYLERKFGEQYRAYKRRVRRWI